jgi:hypothetical protein
MSTLRGMADGKEEIAVNNFRTRGRAIVYWARRALAPIPKSLSPSDMTEHYILWALSDVMAWA